LKKIFLIVTLLLSAEVFSQTIPQEPPFKRFPEFPPVKLLLPDSTNYFIKDDLKKKSKSLLILFSPDCEHCRHETEELLNNIEQFQKVQIIMATFLPFEKMRSFYTEYGLVKYDNIIVGQDFQNFLPSFFMIHNLPFHAFYNKKKALISAFEGTLTVEKMLIELEK
jgi:hypothetical protein